ncbi:MAG TPA: glycosyltransferase family 4 protein [Solirubrobacteraceae bacterium]|nr:glycosyltransferase family 4 protein [Solirubrobacteraceae bacterium]
MRLAILSSGPEPWGGSEELWRQAALDLRRRGHAVDVLKTSVDDAHPRIRELRARGCSVRDLERARLHRLSAAATAVLPPGFAVERKQRQMLAAGAALAARRPAFAIVSQGQNFDGGHLALTCDWLRIPFVLVAQKASETHWPDDVWRPLLTRVFGAARRCVFVSEHNRRLTEQQVGMSMRGAVVLPNPLLVARDGPLPWPGGDGVRLACVARLFAAEKGQDVLLNVLAQERWRARPVTAGLFGEGVNREALVALARRLDLPAVRVEGQVPRIEDVWRGHHALVLPSRAEGLPLSVLEAMACGRVPVVAAVGGVPEVVEDGATGFVAPAPTVELFGDALERAWQARAEWPRIGARAARRVAELAGEEPGPRLAAIAVEEAGHR